MKSLRMSALMLVLGISLFCSLYAHAQQEIDPDHFDRPAATQIHGKNPKPHSGSNKAAVTRHRANVMLASKSAHNSNHHGQARQRARGDLQDN